MGFDGESTAEQVLRGHDLHGRRALVTGGTSGLGTETVRALAAAGARVLFTGRGEKPDADAFARLRAEAGPDAGELEYRQLDLGSLASVRAFAAALADEGARLDLVIANAGVMATPFGRTADGFETQFGTNHLGHFALVEGLAPCLRAAEAPRVVVLSSRGHRRGDVDFADPHYEHRPYDPWEAYGQAKSANALHAVGLARRYGAAGLLAFSVMPGGIATGLQRHMPTEQLQAMGWADAAGNRIVPEGWKTIPQGAATSVWAAVAPELADGARNGGYLEDCAPAQVWTGPDEQVPTGFVLARAQDPERADRLWELSSRLTG
jgi:NAD(P)-dependent dehydrogenase (short-subunit alcohol dehydrogenase family)